MGLSTDFIFVQDDEPKYTALNARIWLLYNAPKVFKYSHS